MKGAWDFLSNGLKFMILWFTRKDSDELRRNDKAKSESDLQDDAEKAVKEKNEDDIRDMLS